jgi:hypothetical protein
VVAQTVEVTRLVPQTIEVTRVVPQTVMATQSAITITPQPTNPTFMAPQPVIDTGYYEGIVVITQYYTFLGHGLYEEAYLLLSTSARGHSGSLDDYVSMAKLSFKTVEIVTIQPYYEAVRQQGGQSEPDPNGLKRFVVQIRSWGEGNMSGSRINGELQELFLELVLEEGV